MTINWQNIVDQIKKAEPIVNDMATSFDQLVKTLEKNKDSIEVIADQANTIKENSSQAVGWLASFKQTLSNIFRR